MQDELASNATTFEGPPTCTPQLFFTVVGLHAVTVPQDPVKLRRERRDMLAALLAVGLDPERCTIFHQDQVPEHAELAWILNCIAPYGRLQRMTTWKVSTRKNGIRAVA